MYNPVLGRWYFSIIKTITYSVVMHQYNHLTFLSRNAAQENCVQKRIFSYFSELWYFSIVDLSFIQLTSIHETQSVLLIQV